ncbi:MAG: MBL fold metallo-hydrolase, partial [Planctomycetota bacterium]
MSAAAFECVSGGVLKLWAGTRPTPGLGGCWLGQAGFALRAGRKRILIDPYLSDHLAQKYRGAELPHERMMPAPIEPQALRRIDWVFCTHAHGDHMDPVTLPLIAETSPACRFVIPAAESQTAIDRGLPASRLLLVSASERHTLDAGLDLAVVPAAHEERRRDARGRDHFLGYAIRHDNACVYHSGDCVPFDSLADEVRALDADLALLPVNGRDEKRRSRGIPGNFTFAEAVDLCETTGIARMVPHHFGMFSFNTISQNDLDAYLVRFADRLRIEPPR